MKYLLFLLFASTAFADQRADKLIDKALEIEQEQVRHLGEMRRSLVELDKTVATLRSKDGCLILDDECSHKKHLEWMENSKAKRKAWKEKEDIWQKEYDEHWNTILISKGWK